jgi:hypothetical protein
MKNIVNIADILNIIDNIFVFFPAISMKYIEEIDKPTIRLA